MDQPLKLRSGAVSAEPPDHEIIEAVLQPVGGLHWDQRILDMLAGALDLGLTSADCTDARIVLRSELRQFAGELLALRAESRETPDKET